MSLSITRPSQIYDFIEETVHSGYHKIYNSIKFIYLHTLDFTIINTTCLYGGKIEVELGDYKIKNIDEDVTIAPDQIAVYKTTLEDNIKTYFYLI